MKLGIDPQNLQAQMQRLKSAAQAGGKVDGSIGTQPSQGAGFGSVLNNAIDTVNNLQMQSSQAATRIETGDGGASLVKAVIASQKANVAFEATVQVRNKVVSAYQDIMNMPI